MTILAVTIDVLEKVLPAGAVVLGIIVAAIFMGRKGLSESHQKGQQAGADLAKKLAERLGGKKPPQK